MEVYLMERYVWKCRLAHGMREEYIKRHENLWPEMKQELKNAGMRNYSIWLIGDDLFGYYECDNLEYALKYQAESEVCIHWEKTMEPLITLLTGPDKIPVEQVFMFEG